MMAKDFDCLSGTVGLYNVSMIYLPLPRTDLVCSLVCINQEYL